MAMQCSLALKMSILLLVDTMDDQVGHAYSGMPDRLYVIGTDGRVVYKGGRGPFGFRPQEMEQSLVMLLDEEKTKPAREKPVTPAPQGRLPVLDNEVAWARLPGAPSRVEALPHWARQLAGPLPQTTAQMVKLDALHRTGQHLDPMLRLRMRWIAANANGCAYSKAVAIADMERLGAKAEERDRLTREPDSFSEAEKAAFQFAKKLTLDGASVTDAEVETLLRHFGDQKVMGMVALIAHANFQDRVILALNPPIESGGPPAPVQARFPHKRTPPPNPRVGAGAAAGSSSPMAPPSAPREPGLGANLPGVEGVWKDQTFGDLLTRLDQQKERKGRIRVPDWQEVEPRITQESWAVRLPRVLWNRVCYAHQPELTDGFFDCVDAFRQESRMDRLLGQDIFWVVTRSINCFY